VKTEQTNGKFDVHGVNAASHDRIAGSGSIRTVNGPTVVSFRQNRNAASDFNGLTGPYDAAVPPGLSADFRFKTLNGQAYTDFESTLVPRAASAGERRGGRFVYKANHFSSVRVGAGGPELSLRPSTVIFESRKRLVKMYRVASHCARPGVSDAPGSRRTKSPYRSQSVPAGDLKVHLIPAASR